MTHSPTPTELLALRTANAALLNSPDVYTDFASTIVFALGSAQLLQSPETAAELSRLRLIQNAQPAELSEAQIDALADAGNRALNDHYHDDLCHCSDWPESCASSGNYFAGSWDTAAFGIGMAAVIGVWESMRAPAEADELARLSESLHLQIDHQREGKARWRARAEAAEARVAELEAERSNLLADRDAQIVAWLGKKAHEYGTSNAEKRAKAEAVSRMADKLSRGAVRRPLEDPHDSPLHHEYRLGHDLPEVPHA